MKKDALFFSFALIVTMLIIRTSVFVFPLQKLRIDGTVIHHFWLGVLVLLLVIGIPKRYIRFRIGLAAIGFGLTVDEFVYMILGDGPVSQYWSMTSVIGAAGIATMLVAIRNKLTSYLT